MYSITKKVDVGRFLSASNEYGLFFELNQGITFILNCLVNAGKEEQTTAAGVDGIYSSKKIALMALTLLHRHSGLLEAKKPSDESYYPSYRGSITPRTARLQTFSKLYTDQVLASTNFIEFQESSTSN